MRKYLGKWNFIRAFRLILGIFIIVEGFRSQEYILLLFGGLFSLMPLLNIGCCGTANCNVSIPKSKDDSKEVFYEEVK